MQQDSRLLLRVVQTGPLAALVGQIDAPPVFGQVIPNRLLLQVRLAR